MTTYIQAGDGYLYEYNLLTKYCKEKGIPYEPVFGIKAPKITSRKGLFCAGALPFMNDIFKQVGSLVTPNTYPYPLRYNFMHRKIEETLLYKVPSTYKGFIKPAFQPKAFTGFVVNKSDDLLQLSSLDKTLQVYLSGIVNFETEWRYYISNNKIVADAYYAGKKDLAPDKAVVKHAIRILDDHAGPVSYCLDFEVLLDGRTALVEYNDAYSVGWYVEGQAGIYYNFLKDRFDQLLGTRV